VKVIKHRRKRKLHGVTVTLIPKHDPHQ